MTISAMHIVSGGRNADAAYTVVCKSGQRGIEFSDARLAAQAFLRASEGDRPFVLRHRGNVTYVIASVKTGAKMISMSGSGDESFRAAFESLSCND